jgi:hypothetical protein
MKPGETPAPQIHETKKGVIGTARTTGRLGMVGFAVSEEAIQRVLEQMKRAKPDATKTDAINAIATPL